MRRINTLKIHVPSTRGVIHRDEKSFCAEKRMPEVPTVPVPTRLLRLTFDNENLQSFGQIRIAGL